ncbi:hypothetical protein GCM10010404_22150 [Nonomuraea africana]|uniref:Glycosyltransferase RgtA/B/C/D-like domain-containing protein n=1 Tax=Nonomuraea africana TaxID=46171 RepID=A0ABR9KTU9_9ACTN|nr:hypothetical protein [Nonomuraea africana]MBE1565474.1 hypothetical protein [Nonomuraea africana]
MTVERSTARTFLFIQVVLLLWWAAFYPGLFSRDSALYLTHTLEGPWVSDHSVLYDALLWLSVKATGEVSPVTFLQTTAMAAAVALLAQELKRLGAPRVPTTIAAVLLPFAPPFGAFAVTFWKDVPFTACVIGITAVIARIAKNRGPTRGTLIGLGAVMLGAGLFRANGFLVVAITVIVLVIIGKGARARLAVTGLVAAGVPVLLTNLILPQVGIVPPSRTFVYHTAYGDIAVAWKERTDLFTTQDVALMAEIAPLDRWWRGANCNTINPLIWREDFDWRRADELSPQVMALWQRLLIEAPDQVIKTRLCRGAIAWRPGADRWSEGGETYHFSHRWFTWEYVGPYAIERHPEYESFNLRPLSQPLNDLANEWLWASYEPDLDWLVWRGPIWCYASYLALGVAAWLRGNRWVFAIAAAMLGQQAAVLANISAQDFRYMASPIFIGFLMLPLLVRFWRAGRG